MTKLLITDAEIRDLEAAARLTGQLQITNAIARLRSAEEALKQVCNYACPEDDWTDELVDVQ